MSLKSPLVDLTSSAAAVRKTGQGHQAEHQHTSPEPVASQSASTAADPQTLGPEDPGVEHTLSWFGNRFSEDPQYLGETAGGTDLIDEARFTEEGKVHRHAWRGPLAKTQRRSRGERIPTHGAGIETPRLYKLRGRSFGKLCLAWRPCWLKRGRRTPSCKILRLPLARTPHASRPQNL